jgi:hypothetical protein
LDGLAGQPWVVHWNGSQLSRQKVIQMSRQPTAADESGQQQSSFPDKKEKPTTEEYLNADLDDVLDRLNKNPNSLESEAEFIGAVITVRHARIIEKLNNRLVLLTGIAAFATAVLVFVPFFTPSLEAQRLDIKVGSMQKAINDLKAESELLKQQVQQLKHAISALSNQPRDLVPRSTSVPVQKLDTP